MFLEQEINQHIKSIIYYFSVIIKEIRNGMTSWDLALYSLREISILHRIDHPNIPHLMYFIMI